MHLWLPLCLELTRRLRVCPRSPLLAGCLVEYQRPTRHTIIDFFE